MVDTISTVSSVFAESLCEFFFRSVSVADLIVRIAINCYFGEVRQSKESEATGRMNDVVLDLILKSRRLSTPQIDSLQIPSSSPIEPFVASQ